MLTQLEQTVSDKTEYIKIENYLYEQLNTSRKKINQALSRLEHQQAVQLQNAILAGITILDNIKRS